MSENGARNEEYSAHPDSAVAKGDSDMAKELDDVLIDQIWQDLSGQVSRVRIREVAAEVAARFQDARVKTFVPILIRRNTCEQLRAGGDDQV